MKRPCLHIIIIYCIGIIFLNIFNVDINLVKILFLLSIFTGVILILIKKRIEYFKYILLLSIFLVGILNSNYYIKSQKVPKIYDEKVKAVAIVKEVLTKEEDYEKYILHIEKINHNNKTYIIDEQVICNIYEQTDIKLGDRILTDIEIKKPNRNTNPKLFNYKLHLESKGIFATATCNKNSTRILSRDNLSATEKLAIKVKKHIELSLDKSLNSQNSGIIKSIVLGDDSFLSEDKVNSFRKLGLSHILAVSGLHIGIIFGFIIYILDLFKMHRKLSMIISIIIICIYAFLIGFPPSVLRASLMFTFLAIGKIMNSRYDSINILSFTGFLMLIYRPTWIFSVGFQLSFIATFTILLFLPKIQNIITIKNKKLRSALVIIVTAQVGVLPISLYYFNELQTLSIISNLIIAPILTLGIVIGFIIILISVLSMKLAVTIGLIGNVVLNLSSGIVDILSKMTVLNLWMKSPTYLEIIFYYLTLLILLRVIDIEKMDKKIQHTLYINFFIIVTFAIVIQSSHEDINVEFIDVGQGDACLVRLKNKNILIDSGGNIFGNFDIGENILLPYLRKTGVRTLDGVFLSHYHADHVKAIMPLFSQMKLENIFIGYESKENELYKEIIKSSRAYNVKINKITRGNILKLDKNAYIEVLQPPKSISNYEGENDKSLVFILHIYDKKILFTGDIEEKAEDYIINNTKQRNVDIIKVAHHGSKTSSKKEFVQFFSPKIAIFQVGKNSFGHPNEDVLKRYKENDTMIFRNDISGLIKVVITKENMGLEGYLKEKEHFSRFIIKNISFGMYVIYGSVIYLMILRYKQREKDKL